jgi:hypothetical protein
MQPRAVRFVELYKRGKKVILTCSGAGGSREGVIYENTLT